MPNSDFQIDLILTWMPHVNVTRIASIKISNAMDHVGEKDGGRAVVVGSEIGFNTLILDSILKLNTLQMNAREVRYAKWQYNH